MQHAHHTNSSLHRCHQHATHLCKLGVLHPLLKAAVGSIAPVPGLGTCKRTFRGSYRRLGSLERGCPLVTGFSGSLQCCSHGIGVQLNQLCLELLWKAVKNALATFTKPSVYVDSAFFFTVAHVFMHASLQMHLCKCTCAAPIKHNTPERRTPTHSFQHATKYLLQVGAFLLQRLLLDVPLARHVHQLA